MHGVVRGNQQKTFGTVFANVSHFQKCYNKDFLGISEFTLIQEFNKWSALVDTLKKRGIGEKIILNKTAKGDVYSEVAEDLLAYIENNETNTHSKYITTIWTSNKELAVTRSFGNIYNSGEICSIEEFIMRRLVSNKN